MHMNERGGIISNLIIIPAAVTLMVGFFFLGYYVGRYQSKPGVPGENAPPLPEVVSRNLPKPEDFTFYKTLTGKENKTVSIELKPKAADAGVKPEKKQAAEEPKDNAQQPAKGKAADAKPDKRTSTPETVKQSAVKPAAVPEKKAPPKQAASSKLHYTIQVSAHQEKNAAEEEVKKMKQSGYAAFIVSSELPDKGMWYRVRLGSFSNKAAAEKLQKEVREKAGGSPIVVLE